MSVRRLWPWAALLCLLALHLWLYLGPFAEAALFNVDVERDLVRVLTWLEGGAYPFAGPNISDTTITLGSMFYLLLAPVLLVSGDPAFVRGVFVLAATGGLGVFFLILRSEVRTTTALLAVLWLFATGYWFENLRQLWHSNLLPIVVAIYLLGIRRALDEDAHRAWITVAAVAAAVAVQLHATMVSLAIVGVLVLALKRRQLGARGIAAALAAALVTLTPFFLGLFLGDVEATPELERWLGYDTGSPADVATYVAWSTIPGYGLPGYDGWLTLPYGLPALGLLVPIAALVAAIRAFRGGPVFQRLLAVLVLAGLLVQLVVFQQELSTRYLHANIIPLVLLAAAAADAIPARLGVPTAAVLGAAMIVFGLTRQGSPGDRQSGYCGLSAQSEMARLVVDGVGIPAVDVAYRVHGLTCRHRASGAAYFYRARPQSAERAAEARRADKHVFFMPSEVDLTPAALETFSVTELGPPSRRLRAVVYRPAVDYRRRIEYVTRTRGRPGPRNVEAGRRSARAGAERGRLKVPIRPGDHTLHLRFWQGGGPECPVRATRSDGRPVQPVRMEGGSRGNQRLFRLVFGTATEVVLQVDVGPCADLDAVDVF